MGSGQAKVSFNPSFFMSIFQIAKLNIHENFTVLFLAFAKHEYSCKRMYCRRKSTNVQLIILVYPLVKSLFVCNYIGVFLHKFIILSPFLSVICNVAN